MTKTILIIGGSFGSIKAAWTLRHLLDESIGLLLFRISHELHSEPHFQELFSRI